MTDSPAHPKHVFKDGHVLVVYASNHGHTAKIAARLAETMRGHGLEVDLRDVASAAGAQPGRYELAVIAASVHRQQHQKEIFDWVAARYEALTEMRSVFISVSLTAAEDTDEGRAGAQRCIDDFTARTGWAPTRTESLAGSLQYREYDFFTRQLMRLLMTKMGHTSDVSHDHDYTDWDRVERLGVELAALASETKVG